MSIINTKLLYYCDIVFAERCTSLLTAAKRPEIEPNQWGERRSRSTGCVDQTIGDVFPGESLTSGRVGGRWEVGGGRWEVGGGRWEGGGREVGGGC